MENCESRCDLQIEDQCFFQDQIEFGHAQTLGKDDAHLKKRTLSRCPELNIQRELHLLVNYKSYFLHRIQQESGEEERWSEVEEV